MVKIKGHKKTIVFYGHNQGISIVSFIIIMWMFQKGCIDFLVNLNTKGEYKVSNMPKKFVDITMSKALYLVAPSEL